MKADQIIDKFALRATCTVGGKKGQKMDEACIQRFVKGDPSGRGKYLEWMLFQAGGGKARYDKSIQQWSMGSHGEESIRDQLRKVWIDDAVSGFRDDFGNPVKPVSLEEAERSWAENEESLRKQHVFGDEDYSSFGGFAFHRSWPGKGDLYELIVSSVQRFHRHQQTLRAKGKSTDLCLHQYPNLTDLLIALKDITAQELKEDLDYDVVYKDNYLAVVCPFNIGASLKFGIDKWCTANESMFLQALSGEGINRWHEYASRSSLYYFRFKQMDKFGFPFNACAVELRWEMDSTKGIEKQISEANYWDAEDEPRNLREWLNKMATNKSVTIQHMKSFKAAVQKMKEHYRNFPRSRVVTSFVGNQST